MRTALPQIIGLSGQARSGKDTAAHYLVSNYGFTKIAWADALRECCRVLNPIVGWDTLGPVRWAQLFDDVGYEAAKDHPEFGTEFRRIMLTMGTEVGRNILGENTWVNAALDKMEPGKRYVISDCRFPNEAEAVTERGGHMVRILRGGLPTIDHPSETGLDDWDFHGIVANNRTMADFYEALDELLAVLHLGRPTSV